MSERRQSARFCPAKLPDVTFTDSSGVERTASVLNESIGGAALSCADGCVMIPGTTVTVMYHGTPVSAIVWHSRRETEGTIVVGIEWMD